MKDKGTIYTYTIDDLVTGLDRMLTAIGKADKVWYSAKEDYMNLTDNDAPKVHTIRFMKDKKLYKVFVVERALRKTSYATMLYLCSKCYQDKVEAKIYE